MIRRTVKIQLVAFLLLTLVTVSVLSARYVGLYDQVAGGQYHVAADFEQSGGIFVGSEVTYRGVTVGRVDDLKLSKDGVLVDAKIQRGVVIPKDTKVVVENRSAVGEQYLDFQPRSDGGPSLKNGDTIARKDTAYPLRVDTLLLNLDQTVNSVNKQDLRTVVDELGTGFADGGQDLQRLIDSGDKLTRSATEALPQTIKLIDDGRIVLDTQRDTAGNVKVFAKNFADLSETLKSSDGDLRLILDRGVVASKELETLIRDNRGNLAALLANLITVGQVTTARVDGIRQLLVTYPDVVAGGYTVVPGDGTAHFGLALAHDPPVCTQGYQGTPRRSPNQTSDIKANTSARCTAPRGSATSVRGAQNAPGPQSSTNSTVPFAFGDQPVSPGMAASLGMTTPQVSVPLPPSTGEGSDASWLWIMKEAAR
ncbi:phospholipid/cholesterol/gamma-HCH transport system substrate-binding protein [Phycicoccus badiiscoriae]|uniref:Phospholipid/cholesterol/gamma-HCH transport system substrate-binding protein n=1 Tax=Pedococcus badiiscoriae TaxID=642776 RepID=A0A852WB81_9MICO|nr:MlaD family protein [Pedococcus badiiscoriae]NYG06353.1 phospholipid/cholesterol/gamma-HCH transport system substrate-binding protein [Pedococcus badiiscoriae]